MSIPYTDIDRLYIDGQWVAPGGGVDIIVNPATEQAIGQAPIGTTRELEHAIDAARRAFDHGPWPSLSMSVRITVVDRFREAILEHAQEIKQLLIAEAGSSQLLLNSAQFNGALQAIDYALHLARTLDLQQPLPVDVRPNPFAPSAPDMLGGGVTLLEPYGVVAGITPYNYPFLLPVVKLIPALLTGNTVILKPSPFTPFSTLLLGRLAEQAGLPNGILNIVTGGADIGNRLTADPRVDLVTFTGSDKVGTAILKQSADTLKKVHLELGGKSALIVRHDADIKKAADIAAFNMSLHAGQGCALLTRYIVHNAVRPTFVETMKAILAQLKIGDPADPSVVVGPLIRETALSKTEHYVRQARDSGATLAYGGRRPPHLTKGYFHEPTLFDNVDNSSALAQEEVFGPVGAVIGFDTDEEAVRLANTSRFGLSGGVLSADHATAFRMAQKLRSGGVGINGGIGDMFVKAPFGGYRHSGIGREFGPRWLHEFLLEKAVTYPLG